MSQRLKLFLPLALFALLALFLARGLELDPKALPSALIDQPLPDFRLSALDSGVTLERSDVIGEAALFNVWATWCATCRVEHPFLQRLADEGVPVYGINYKDDPAAARQWLAQLGDPYRLSLVDAEGTLGLDLGVYGAPETYLVDAGGTVRYRHVGEVNARVWEATLGPLYREIAAAGEGRP